MGLLRSFQTHSETLIPILTGHPVTINKPRKTEKPPKAVLGDQPSFHQTPKDRETSEGSVGRPAKLSPNPGRSGNLRRQCWKTSQAFTKPRKTGKPPKAVLEDQPSFHQTLKNRETSEGSVGRPAKLSPNPERPENLGRQCWKTSQAFTKLRKIEKPSKAVLEDQPSFHQTPEDRETFEGSVAKPAKLSPNPERPENLRRLY